MNKRALRFLGDDSGQSLVLGAFFLALVGVVLVAAMGVAALYGFTAFTQSAADAAALAGARTVLVRDWMVGGRTVCGLVEIDTERAQAEAEQVWDRNLSALGVNLLTNSFDVRFSPPSRPRRVFIEAHVSLSSSVLGVVGRPVVDWTVLAEGEAGQECSNPLTGPVFALPIMPPPGWPDPSAEVVWNVPMADRNAPSGWPVYFLRVFELGAPSDVTFYAAANGTYELYVDGDLVLAGAGSLSTGPQSSTVSLWRGRHAVLVKVTNPAAVGVPTAPSPAGVIVAAHDEEGKLVLATTGNPLSNAGQPVDPETDWGSWSPPHPDWAVYVDPFYGTTDWLQNGAALARYLAEAGFVPLSASSLADWMRDKIDSGRAPRAVVVFAQDVVPDTIVETRPSPNALLRRYLDAGGSVIWLGMVPLYYRGVPGGSYGSSDWGLMGAREVLGVSDDESRWYAWNTGTATDAGRTYGIGVSPWWWTPPGGRALAPGCWPQALAVVPNGGYSAWRSSYWPNPPDCSLGSEYVAAAWSLNSPGFVRIADAPLDLSDPRALVAVLMVAGQIAGWYVASFP